MYSKYFIVLYFVFILCDTVISQEHYSFQVVGAYTGRFKKLENKTFKSKEDLEKAIEKVHYKHIKKGFVLASVDSLVWNHQNGYLHYYLGPRFSQLVVNVAPKDAYLVRKIPRLSEKQLRNAPFKPEEIAVLLDGIVDYLQNNGYPFAAVKLNVQNLDPENAVADLIIKRGNEVTISEINIKGESQINKNFITNFLAIKEGDLYSEDRMRKISQRINQLNFIEEIKSHEVLFTEEGAALYLYLNSSPVSLVNGVLGLQPNPVTGENVITGDIRLKLQNGLKKGELLDVNWRSLQPSTQDLKTHLNYPFLFNTPFGVDAKFDLYRRDSTFMTTLFDLGVQYFMRGGNYLKVFFEAEGSNPLSAAGVAPSNLPNTNFSAVNSNRYGIGIFRRQLDYLPNPSKGFFVEVDGLVGRRTSRILDADSSEISTTYTLRFDAEVFLPLARRHVIRIANQTRYYYAEEVFVNELYRFGGLTSQRGFDEEELFASSRSTFSIEYRFLADRNSHAFAFFDQSLYENRSDAYYRDFPYGVGAGFSFGTNLGIFSISYAVGKQFDNPILLRNGKVHFGYVSYF